MPNTIRDIKTVDADSYPYIFEQNVSIPLRSGSVLRCNVYRPKEEGRYPVIATCGPYGKDVPYKSFHPASFAEINPEHQTDHSAWETPTPSYWTRHGYVVVRADEPGTGQSPGILNVKSAATVDAFHTVVEWAVEQPWSSGKVGLMGISYYAASQWQVAAKHPKGLAALVPYEGFSDSYMESTRHGGILSNEFYNRWYPRQVASNQYGLPGKAARNWGPDTVEGDLGEEELKDNRVDGLEVMRAAKYRDHPLFKATEVDLESISVPVLSVGNLGGISLHLRGNVLGYTRASSEFKYLRFIAGRHDIPFYYPEEVQVQLSFLDAFLKGDDRVGWSEKGKVAPVSLLLRKGDVGYNDPESEKAFKRREESQWPLSNTQYTDYFLTTERRLVPEKPQTPQPATVDYMAYGIAPDAGSAPGTGSKPPPPPSPEHKPSGASSFGDGTVVSFESEPFSTETEITGHIVAHLNVSVGKDSSATNVPGEIDLFITLRHLSASGKEISYTGSVGDPVPIAKGWLRVSLRKINPDHPLHRPWLPYRDCSSESVQPVTVDEVYPVDVEVWPTNVVVDAGARLVLEVSSCDTAGAGIWGHTDPVDRPADVLRGINRIHFGPDHLNYVTLPIIPAALSGA
ncbi:uncharacterized protein PV06_08345 [Exophiala oligosperma]|uniref:Xaa-Pro dipeptidyl-peptidase C-terminal domain-containing protein n=1 Tax=Exophiala oligosperma TaxID=215243 RepID=A0A0D2DB93_9EURO|nr:uncharacterized protein PV06_08345 [Exophiala oligosperma]KIW39760.1 hypothetical protein PV06_08345 [Exophiala oligosperma]